MKSSIRHGEVILKPIDSLPSEAQLVKKSKKEIIAHSETGHHHTLVANRPFRVYSWNGSTYLEISELSNLIHEKTGDYVHTPHKIEPGIYKINIKRQYDYASKKLSQVRD